MANFICDFHGVRGRVLHLYDTKIVITTKTTLGSILTRNATDGEKTIFFCDIVGVQLKRSGLLIGYLQFETPSMQMNNKNDNMFSENTFTFENGKNGITNEIIRELYSYIVDRIEEIKYKTESSVKAPDFKTMMGHYTVVQDENEYPTENDTPDEYAEAAIDKISQWTALEYEQGINIGKCERCNTKKQQLVLTTIKDQQGERDIRICYDCFSKL